VPGGQRQHHDTLTVIDVPHHKEAWVVRAQETLGTVRKVETSPRHCSDFRNDAVTQSRQVRQSEVVRDAGALSLDPVKNRVGAAILTDGFIVRLPFDRFLRQRLPTSLFYERNAVRRSYMHAEYKLGPHAAFLWGKRFLRDHLFHDSSAVVVQPREELRFEARPLAGISIGERIQINLKAGGFRRTPEVVDCSGDVFDNPELARPVFGARAAPRGQVELWRVVMSSRLVHWRWRVDGNQVGRVKALSFPAKLSLTTRSITPG
jgi:hypothetical protein